jgi:hypothetical protein
MVRFAWKRLPLCIILLLAAGCAVRHPGPATQTAGADAQLPRHYPCHRAADAIVIDGRLDEPAWAAAPWTEPFVDIEGSRKPQPRYQTRAKLLWDDAYLYIGAELEEPHVWATLTQHDDIVFRDNDFEVFIDPDGDRREYYEIEVNALGTIFDLFLVRTYIDGGPALHGWDCKGLKSAVHVAGTLNDPSDVDRGWLVELALPWQALAEAAHRPAPPQDGNTWRINFSRVEWQVWAVDGQYEKRPNTRENNWVWSPQGVVNMHLPEHWGYLRFTTGGD